ncbi:hypothetical protein B7P43_G09368 [Cryptotermes secundus]|uniref:Uncharacterized protein n=1 Tax=Cryptotermes secundus TaxID=105785 RepID=A0A2J7QDH4_9NEOP|nr:hypothetical protein B7P43_G09368 [Cryptotermes secundus]
MQWINRSYPNIITETYSPFCFRKKIVIHVPTSVKHIYHHHTKEVLVKPKQHHEHSLEGDGWSLLENTDGWSVEHVTGHGLSGSDHEDWYKSKGRHGRGHGHWHEGKGSEDFLLGIRNIGEEKPQVGSAGKSPSGWKQGRDGSFGSKGSGVWQTVKGHAGNLNGFVHGKFWEDGTDSRGSNRERRHQLSGHEGSFISGTTRQRGRYAVKEHSEEDKIRGTGVSLSTDKYGGPNAADWDELGKTIGGHRGKHSPTSSSEAKDHIRSSYSNFVLHSVRDGRQSA